MPIHDWTKVPAGLFHHFHHRWCGDIADVLNGGALPKGLTALVEQRTGTKVPDVLAIEVPNSFTPDRLRTSGGGVATLERPKTRFEYRSDREIYADKANRIAVKHRLGRTVAIIEIVSPGNKDSRGAMRQFVEKTGEFISLGIHVLIIDLFPPTKRDPAGIHAVMWEEFGSDDDFTLPPHKDRVLASYEAAPERSAFVETIGVGDALPQMPLFLPGGFHVNVPLEEAYTFTWNRCPEILREAVITGKLPEADEEAE